MLDKDFIESLRQEFLSDPDDHRNQLGDCVSQYKDDPEETTRTIMRTLHNLKGSAQAVGYEGMAKLFHQFETALQKLEECDLSNTTQIELLLPLIETCVVEVNTYFDVLKAHNEENDPYENMWKQSVEALTAFTEDWSNSAIQETPEPEVAAAPEPEVAAAPEPEVEAAPEPEVAAAPEPEPDMSDSGWSLFDDAEPEVAPEPKTEEATEPDSDGGWALFGDDEPKEETKEVEETPEPESDNSWALFDDDSEDEVEKSEEEIAEPAADEAWALFDEPAPQEEAKEVDAKQEDEHEEQQREEIEATSKADDETDKSDEPPEEEADLFLKSQYLICIHNEQQYALPVSMVREIMPSSKPSKLPTEEDGILGVIPVRGTILPIIDMSEVFGTGDEVSSTNGCIIILESGQTNFGINVDAATHVLSIEDGLKQNITTELQDTTTGKLSHIAKLPEGSVLFIDINSIVAA